MTLGTRNKALEKVFGALDPPRRESRGTDWGKKKKSELSMLHIFLLKLFMGFVVNVLL